MPTVFSHAALGFAAAEIAIPRDRSHPRLVWAASLLPVVPDLDALFMRWIPYRAPWGHRGMTHSILFGLALGALAALWVKPREGILSNSWWKLALFLGVLTASHGVLDAMTNGGHGIALLAPFDHGRYFLPFRPIAVSPLGLGFLSLEGLLVLLWEFVLLWPWAVGATLWKRHDAAWARRVAVAAWALASTAWLGAFLGTM